MRQVGDLYAWCALYVAVVGGLRAAQYVQEGGFSFAVAAEQGDFVAGFEGEVRSDCC